MTPDNDNDKDTGPAPAEAGPGAAKPGLVKRCRTAFKKAAAQDWKGIVKQTVRDLKDPKELAIFATSSVLPGGWIGYGSYRIAKFNMTKDAPAITADNDNTTPPPAPLAKPAKKWRLKGKTPKP